MGIFKGKPGAQVALFAEGADKLDGGGEGRPGKGIDRMKGDPEAKGDEDMTGIHWVTAKSKGASGDKVAWFL